MAMKIYLVGGAVRDKLLDYPVKERDWVVVGATVEQMLEAGYRQVGKDFPVFLHPESNEEYALARTERKSGHGYTGFTVYSAPDVTLQQDLARRDLTINAMAEDADGNLVDPYGGRADLEHRVLRHVSDAFVEDPLRVLRVARFAARYAHLGFTVAGETHELMRAIAAAGELEHLVAERVWVELERALGERSPTVFVEILRNCDALPVVLPELARLFGVPERTDYHPEGDAGVHSLMVLEQAAALSPKTTVRFAALTHDLGKGVTDPADWPRHIGHERAGVAVIRELCERLRAPNAHRDLAILACRFHLQCHRAGELRPGTVLELLEGADAFRKPERFEELLLACEADVRGRAGTGHAPYPQAQRLRRALAAATGVDSLALREEGLDGKALGEAIRDARLQAISREAPADRQSESNE